MADFKGRIAPLRDLSQEDAGQGGARKVQGSAEPRNIVRRHDTTQHGGEVHERRGRLLELLIGHGPVGGSEVDRAGRDLADAAARADRLVVEIDVRVDLGVFGEPLGIDWVWEGGAGAVDQENLGGGRCMARQSRDHGDQEQHKECEYCTTG